MSGLIDLVRRVTVPPGKTGSADPERCAHPNLEPKHAEPWPAGEAEHRVARLSPAEVRRRWPRQRCTWCGTIYYSSYGHYVAGDW